eukprot:2347427-Rhodomonas_salina.4
MPNITSCRASPSRALDASLDASSARCVHANTHLNARDWLDDGFCARARGTWMRKEGQQHSMRTSRCHRVAFEIFFL